MKKVKKFKLTDIRYAILFLLLMTIFCFTACQPTPVKEVVIGKNDGKLEDKIFSTPVPVSAKPYNAPKTWSETFNLEYLDCAIDAEIVVPNITTYPVIKVEKAKFDLEWTKEIISHFISNPKGMKQDQPSIEELEQRLIDAKRGMYVESPDDPLGEGEFVPYEGQEEDIQEIERQIAELEETGEEPFEDRELTFFPASVVYNTENNEEIHLYASDEELRIQSFNIRRDLLQYESWIEDFTTNYEPDGGKIDNVKITKEEAIAQAESKILEMGLDYANVLHVEKGRIINTNNANVESEGWVIVVTRNYGNGISLYLENENFVGALNMVDENDFSPPWEYETITFYIDETGIRSFEWIFPIEKVGELSSNVEIMPFDEVKQVIKSLIKYGMSNTTYALDESVRELIPKPNITVDKVTLTNLLIPIKDDQKYRMLVPAWLVEYTDLNLKVPSGSAFAFNAITGAKIDMEKIYFDKDISN